MIRRFNLVVVYRNTTRQVSGTSRPVQLMLNTNAIDWHSVRAAAITLLNEMGRWDNFIRQTNGFVWNGSDFYAQFVRANGN